MNVVDRMAAAGMTPFRAWQHVMAGLVRIDSEPCTDPAVPADPPAVVTLHSPPGHRPAAADPPPWLGLRGPQRDPA